MGTKRRWAGGAVVASVAAGLVWWAWPDPDPDPEPVAAAPTPAVAPVPTPASQPTPAPSGPEKSVRIHIRSPADTYVIHGLTVWPGRPTVKHGPAWVQDLDDRIGGPPTPDMLRAMETAGVDLTGASWALGGWSEWSDLVLLRNALYATVHQGDHDAVDEVLDGIDEARQRWPHAEELEQLAVQARFIDRRAWGRQLEVARAVLDEGRDGAQLSSVMAHDAGYHLGSAQPEEPRYLEDHRRLRWVAETFPALRDSMLALGLQLAMTHRQPGEAARWLAEIEALPEGRVLESRERLAFRFGVIAMGGLPAVAWDERIAAAVGSCCDGIQASEEHTVIHVTGHWRGEAWRWYGGRGQPQNEALIACLANADLDGTSSYFDVARVLYVLDSP